MQAPEVSGWRVSSSRGAGILALAESICTACCWKGTHRLPAASSGSQCDVAQGSAHRCLGGGNQFLLQFLRITCLQSSPHLKIQVCHLLQNHPSSQPTANSGGKQHGSVAQLCHLLCDLRQITCSFCASDFLSMKWIQEEQYWESPLWGQIVRSSEDPLPVKQA